VLWSPNRESPGILRYRLFGYLSALCVQGRKTEANSKSSYWYMCV